MRMYAVTCSFFFLFWGWEQLFSVLKHCLQLWQSLLMGSWLYPKE